MVPEKKKYTERTGQPKYKWLMVPEIGFIHCQHLQFSLFFHLNYTFDIKIYKYYCFKGQRLMPNMMGKVLYLK